MTRLQKNGSCTSCMRAEKLHGTKDRFCKVCNTQVTARRVYCTPCRDDILQARDHAKNLCECGAAKTRRAKQCRKCSRLARGPDHRCWRGGRVQLKDGYVRVWAPGHPRCVNGRYVLEHIIAAESTLGRYLYPDERVHHKNKVRNDNRPENLELWSVGHPSGARAEDLLIWAREVTERYQYL